ncbi:otolith matrix protein OMM-64-like isoform X1 [Macrobrachium rosenbergii]|uniref:otolith matrix protein OMM-64-like isoform X1 n=1 Tax=Macrobrachium rosenbergii TaxID=79674 RepID=UPI0034D6CE28
MEYCVAYNCRIGYRNSSRENGITFHRRNERRKKGDTMNNMNSETFFNDIPFLGEPSGRPYVPVNQFRVMTPPRPHGFAYSPPPGGNSIDAIRARRARLEALTSKVKLPPLVTNGGEVELPPLDPTSSVVSIRSGSSDSQERWLSATMRPPSTKGHPTVPFVPYHNPLPDISREKVVEEEEPMLETGLDSPPPPTEEDTFKVSKWVEQLPDEADTAKEDDESIAEKTSTVDEEIVENWEEEEELGRSVVDEPIAEKLDSAGKASRVSSFKGPMSENVDIAETLPDKENTEVEKLSMGKPSGSPSQIVGVDTEEDTTSYTGLSQLFTVIRDRESIDEGQALTETDLPVQDIEIGGDNKEEENRTPSPAQLIDETLAASETEQKNDMQWQQTDSIFTTSPASVKEEIFNFDTGKDMSSENDADNNTNIEENTEVEDLVTDITEDKPNESSENQDLEWGGENTDTINQENGDDANEITHFDKVSNHSGDNEVTTLDGANSDIQDQGGDDNNVDFFSSDAAPNFSDQELKLGDENSDTKDQEVDDETKETANSDQENIPSEVQEFKLETSDNGDDDQTEEVLRPDSKLSTQNTESLHPNEAENQSMQNPASRPGSVQLEPEGSGEEANIPEDLKFLEKNADDSESLTEDIDFMMPTISPDSAKLDSGSSKSAGHSEGYFGSADQVSPVPDQDNDSVKIKASDIINDMKEKDSLKEIIETGDSVEDIL